MKWFEAANCDYLGYGDEYLTRREWERAEVVQDEIADDEGETDDE